MKGKTKSGFEFEVRDNVLDDYEVIEAIADMGREPFAMVRVVDMVFTPESKAAAKDFIREQEGYVSQKAMDELVAEVFKALRDSSKNP